MIPRRALIFLGLVCILVVLYPDPGLLVRSVRNIASPRVDSAVVSDIAARLPNDPARIEAYVLNARVPYAYDWQSSGVPWYFPTTREAIRQGRGDCESRALVLASILTAKGIPNELRVSLDHIWVDYPGKQANALENAGVEIAGQSNGHFFLHWPANLDLGQEWADQVAIFWTPAPPVRVALLFGGLMLIALWNVLARLAGGSRRALSDPEALAEATAPAGRRQRRRPAGRRSHAGFVARPHRV